MLRREVGIQRTGDSAFSHLAGPDEEAPWSTSLETHAAFKKPAKPTGLLKAATPVNKPPPRGKRCPRLSFLPDGEVLYKLYPENLILSIVLGICFLTSCVILSVIYSSV